MKRFRKPVAKPGELLVKYGKHYGYEDLFYCWPDNKSRMKSDSRILCDAIERVKIFDGKTLRQILIDRGYDITTFKLSVKKKEVMPSESTGNNTNRGTIVAPGGYIRPNTQLVKKLNS
ncbi:MAG: hypothetical protein SVO01_00075 [Thermotogota bacterium]|nr:hypothetical protein [Thermotogota bacterium]